MGEFVGEIVEIKDETYDVKSFRIRLSEDIDYIPGQYCLVSFIDRLKGQAKPFTFASSPAEKGYILLTVKKVGEFTIALHSLEKGAMIKINGPYGVNLNFNESVKEDVIFIAGGSGITPFISALRYSVAKRLPNRIILFFSNRIEEDIIFREELAEMNKKENIKIVNTLSGKSYENWDGEIGRINIGMINKHVDGIDNKLWYICAPPPMVNAMKGILKGMGIPEEKIRIEKWQISGKHDKKSSLK